MITDNVGYCTLFHISLNTDQMIESFITFGLFRSFHRGQHRNKLISDTNRVYHLILCISRMYVTSFKSNLCSSSIKVFKFQLSHFTTIHGIRPFTAKLLYIKLMGTFTDFLIRIESDTNLSVFDFRVFFEISYC